VALATAPCLAEAGEWGDLTGRFVYGGNPPTPRRIAITTDVEYCGKCNLIEETLIVDPASRGVANVIVWLYQGRGEAELPIHDSYRARATDVVPLDSTKCRIDPHVTLLRTTQTLMLRNTDPIGDGVRISALVNPSVNILLPPKGEKSFSLPNAERLPVPVSCPVHAWESGWLLVCRHPYMAVSGKDGRFQISRLPCGSWTFQFWHEAAGFVQQVVLGNEPQTWRRGRTEIRITSGSNELGDVILAPALFGK
jgi:hypothetical protein